MRRSGDSTQSEHAPAAVAVAAGVCLRTAAQQHSISLVAALHPRVVAFDLPVSAFVFRARAFVALAVPRRIS